MRNSETVRWNVSDSGRPPILAEPLSVCQPSTALAGFGQLPTAPPCYFPILSSATTSR